MATIITANEKYFSVKLDYNLSEIAGKQSTGMFSERAYAESAEYASSEKTCTANSYGTRFLRHRKGPESGSISRPYYNPNL